MVVLTHAYSVQRNRVTGLFPITILPAHEMLSVTKFDSLTGILTGVSAETLLQNLKTKLPHRVAAMKKTASCRLASAQK